MLPVASLNSMANSLTPSVANNVVMNLPSLLRLILPLRQLVLVCTNSMVKPVNAFPSGEMTLPPTKGSSSVPIGAYSGSIRY